jgi:hypothetical protein
VLATAACEETCAGSAQKMLIADVLEDLARLSAAEDA